MVNGLFIIYIIYLRINIKLHSQSSASLLNVVELEMPLSHKENKNKNTCLPHIC